MIEHNTWMGHEKTLLFRRSTASSLFNRPANEKAENRDENNINITLASSQKCKICSKYCCHATQRCLRWNTNLADEVGYHDDIEFWSRKCMRPIRDIERHAKEGQRRRGSEWLEKSSPFLRFRLVRFFGLFSWLAWFASRIERESLLAGYNIS